MKKRIPLLLSFTSVILLSCTPETVASLMSESESSSVPTTGSVTDCPPSSPDSSYTSLSSSEERHASGNQTTFFKGGESVSVKIILTNEALYVKALKNTSGMEEIPIPINTNTMTFISHALSLRLSGKKDTSTMMSASE